MVRNAHSSTHLNTAAKEFKNVHVIEADVTDYDTLKVSIYLDLKSLPARSVLI